MNGDVLAVIRHNLRMMTVADLDTVEAVGELLAETELRLQFEGLLLRQWLDAGFEMNPPGLVCQVCGGRTMGKMDGNVELVRCVAPDCGIVRRVVVA